MENLNNKKVLIIRLSAIGDTIHTIPLAAAIKKKYPEVLLDWAVEDKASKFIINNPLINRVYELPKKRWKENKNKFANFTDFLNIIKEIRKEKYDIVIDTQQLLKSAVIMGLSGGKRKISLDGGREFSYLFANEIIKTGLKQFDLNKHVVDRNLEIAKYLGCENCGIEFILPDFTDKYSENVKELLENLDKDKKTIVISPATTWENKHWHIKGWVDVINEFKDKCNIIVTAGEKEKSLTNRILSFINDGNIIDLSGKTSLENLIYVMSKADVMVSPDSGSAHIAWAAGKCKIISLFFATSASRTAPKGEGYTSFSSRSQCSPCMKRKCKLKDNVNNCIYNIDSDIIIKNLKKVLQLN